MNAWIDQYCIEVEDAAEDTAILYALTRTHNALGHAALSAELTVVVNDQEYILAQRPEYLRGSSGVTGSVLWSCTPVILDYLLRANFFPGAQGVLELGSGIGLAACVLRKVCAVYLASDHDLALLRLVRRNCDVYAKDVAILQLDWTDDVSSYAGNVSAAFHGHALSYIVCFDCIYSAYLARALVSCLRGLLSQYPQATVVIGQQLREESLHTDFMAELCRSCQVWRVEEELSGYVIYLARLRT